MSQLDCQKWETSLSRSFSETPAPCDMPWGHQLPSHTPIFQKPSHKQPRIIVIFKISKHLCGYIRKRQRKPTSLGSSGIKGLTRSLQSGADAALREVRANRTTTAGRAMVRQRRMWDGSTGRGCHWSCSRKLLTLIHCPSGVSDTKKVVEQVLITGRRGGSTYSDAPVKVCLMTLQTHADFSFSALNSQLISPLLPAALPLNELRQSAKACLWLLRHSKRTWRRLSPCGSEWTPCGDSLKVWRLLSPP